MPSIINATTSTGLVTTADNSGSLQLATNNGTTAVTIDTSQNVTFAKPITVGGNTLGAGNASSFKNRIINGAMVIDQRNAGASVTPTATGYTLDRWVCSLTQASKFSVQQNANSVTPPVGFSKYLGITSLSAYSVLVGDFFLVRQYIEGFNFADLDWGTANAKTVTLSFWVRSSLTGTFGGSVQNSAENRSYPFSYTISSANTWEQKSVTIAGDTTGTWAGATNGVGLRLNFGLGVGSTYSGTAGSWAGADYRSVTGAVSVVGTNGATFYITGVQLEVGSTATSFDYRPYGTELALCQRYYYKVSSNGQQLGVGWNSTTTVAYSMTTFPVTMRTAVSSLEQSGTATNYRVLHAATATTCSAVPAFSRGTDYSAITEFTVASGLTAGQGSAGSVAGGGVTSFIAWSAEL